jgi:hypothetical protein
MGGTLLQPLLTLTVEALPLEIPKAITLQAELLVDFEINFYVSDIEVDERVNVINEASEMVATVVAPRVERIESEDGEGDEIEVEVAGEEAEESTE